MKVCVVKESLFSFQDKYEESKKQSNTERYRWIF